MPKIVIPPSARSPKLGYPAEHDHARWLTLLRAEREAETRGDPVEIFAARHELNEFHAEQGDFALVKDRGYGGAYHE